jgi:hypothetical protein
MMNENEVLRDVLFTVLFCPRQFPRGLPWQRTRSIAVRDRRGFLSWNYVKYLFFLNQLLAQIQQILLQHMAAFVSSFPLVFLQL